METVQIAFLTIFFRCVVGPICPDPPDAPDEGVKEYLPIPFPEETVKNCVLNDEDLSIKCSSFLSIYMRDDKIILIHLNQKKSF